MEKNLHEESGFYFLFDFAWSYAEGEQGELISTLYMFSLPHPILRDSMVQNSSRCCPLAVKSLLKSMGKTNSLII